MNHQMLLQLLSRIEGRRCLVLGDVMLDRFVYGSIGRISPEAPIPVLAVERGVDMPGGAANVARNLVSVGAGAVLIGVVGKDEPAALLGSQLSQLPGMQAQLVEDPGRPTTMKTRFVADGQQMLRADQESSRALPLEIQKRVLSVYQSALNDVEVVILSDYGKGVLCDTVVTEAIATARHAGKPVITDPKSRSFAKYRGVTVLTPNRNELQTACGFECGSDEAVEQGARKILDEGICQTMVVTRGKDGMSIVQSSGGVDHLRTAAREVFDVSGAGDTVIATMSAGIAAGGAIVDACTLANIAAGIVVGKRGTAVATAGEIMAALRPHDGTADPKLFSRDSAVTLAQDWRKQGLTVAFTNGCFDLLHPGHISLIDQARREADRLIVGINSDQSVQRLKGPQRPVQSEIARATVLASLRSVDAVVIFDEDTPLQLIDLLQPDVLVKGADYTLEQVVGADLVLERGGRVFLAELVPGHSTTNTLKRVSAPRPVTGAGKS
jgi:D-beta-D-heptose 7-phosphate kinase/D-beta-D-heptose 1-phosphate adenosyltransferase